jgi:hypothetical protein
MYGFYLDDVREHVRRLPTRCVSSTKKNYRCLGLKSRVVTVCIRALGLDPEDH